VVKCSGSSCQHAQHPGCKCACAHANHGTARLWWAYAKSSSISLPSFGQVSHTERNNYRKQAEDRANRAQELWEKKVVDRLRVASNGHLPMFTNTAGRAGPRKLSDTDIIDWLADRPDVLDEAKFIADQLGDVADEALKLLGPGDKFSRLADHFWCDIVASLVVALEQIKSTSERLTHDAVDWLVDRAWEWLQRSRKSDCANTPNGKLVSGTPRSEKDAVAGVSEEIQKKLLKAFLKRLADGLLKGKIVIVDGIVLKLRIVAIVICPDILVHKLVWDHCFIPLFRLFIDDELKDNIRNFLPQINDLSTWNDPKRRDPPDSL
jgi:hypothetical protein